MRPFLHHVLLCRDYSGIISWAIGVLRPSTNNTFTHPRVVTVQPIGYQQWSTNRRGRAIRTDPIDTERTSFEANRRTGRTGRLVYPVFTRRSFPLDLDFSSWVDVIEFTQPNTRRR